MRVEKKKKKLIKKDIILRMCAKTDIGLHCREAEEVRPVYRY